MKPAFNTSFWLSVSIFLVFGTLFLSTGSPFVAILPILYASSFVLSPRFPRDSANVWGARLLVYAGMAILGRTPTSGGYYGFDAQAFSTVGLVFGGEIVLQSFRQPPKNLKFDPSLILLSGLIFLLACNSRGPHLWLLAPLYIFATLLALGDLRLNRGFVRGGALLWRAGFAALAALLGLGIHDLLFVKQGEIMSFGSQLLNDRASNYQSDTTSDAPHLESSFGANTSTARLMQIEGSLSDSHLRAGAFSDYQKGQWGPPFSSANDRPISPALPQFTREQKTGSTDLRTDYQAKITVLRETNGVVYAPLNAQALVPLGGTSFDWFQFAGPLKITDPVPVSYGIVEAKREINGLQTTQGPLCVAPDAKQRQQLLQVPEEIAPEVKTLARTITREAATPLEKIAAINLYLLQNYKYSQNFVIDNEEPISEFLLRRKTGHCQFFGSGATILLREIGIPARYVTGFWAHETAADGTTIVRGRDAHAWSEAYVDKIGWITVEATPPQGRADPAVSPLPWYQKALEGFQDTFVRVRNWFGRLTQIQIAGLVAIALVIWGAERWRQARKKARLKKHGPQIPADLQPLAQNFEQILAKHGIFLVEGQPWSEAVPADWQAARDWVNHYNRARFSEEEISLENLRTDLEILEKTGVSTSKN